jgi:hypothetical protein
MSDSISSLLEGFLCILEEMQELFQKHVDGLTCGHLDALAVAK